MEKEHLFLWIVGGALDRPGRRLGQPPLSLRSSDTGRFPAQATKVVDDLVTGDDAQPTTKRVVRPLLAKFADVGEYRFEYLLHHVGQVVAF